MGLEIGLEKIDYIPWKSLQDIVPGPSHVYVLYLILFIFNRHTDVLKGYQGR